MGNRETALKLASAGLAVFPCREDKRPFPGVFWRRQSTSDRRQVERWWSDYPDALPALDLAKADLIVIDADRHGGPDGVTAWLGLVGASHELAGIPVVETPSGGQHYFFRQPADAKLGNARGDLPPGIDVRGAGGYVVAAGTELADGRCYRVTGDILAAPPLPDWLRAILTREAAQRLDATPAPAPRPVIVQAAAPSEARRAAYAEAGIAAELDALRTAPRGGRNNALNNAALKLGSLSALAGFGEAEATGWLEQAAAACGLVREDGIRSVRATIRSGWRAGLRNPRTLPAEAGSGLNGAKIARRLTETADGTVYDTATGEVVEEPRPSPAQGQLPASLTVLPGLVGDLVDYIDNTLESPSRPLALLGAIALVGTIISRHWCVETTAHRTFSNIYLIGLAKSGFGKTTVINRVRDLIIEAVDPGRRFNTSGFLGSDDIASSAGFRRELEECPARLFTIDEAGRFVQRSNALRAGSHEREIMTMLMRFYSAATSTFTGSAYAQGRTKPIPNPCALFLGYSTVNDFWDGFTFDNISNGLLPRFLILHERAEPTLRMPPDSSVQRARALAAIRSVIDQRSADRPMTAGNMSGEFPAEPAIVRLAPQAEAFRQEVREMERGLAAELEAEGNPCYAIWHRLTEASMKLALIRVVGMDHRSPRIELADLEWAVGLARWIMADTVTTLSVRGLVASAEERVQRERMERLERMIAERSGLGVITRRAIVNRLKHHGMRYREIDDLIEMFVQGGQIMFDGDAKAAKQDWVYRIGRR